MTPAPPNTPEAASHPPVLCAKCADEIESCHGAHGDWMHTATRAEACPVGGYARPQTITDINRLRRAS